MKKTMQRLLMFLFCFVIVGTVMPDVPGINAMIVSEAHSGRTDSQGGHHDYKNKSGLGDYHYHCGGNPPHLHENGVCPYKSGGQSSSSQTSSANKASGSDAAAAASTVTVDLMNSYQLVFDADYYYEHNTDLQTAIGTDKLKLFEHFYNTGMAEGRRGNEAFDVKSYKEHNEDLRNSFGDDWKAYYEHYIRTGYSEDRVH